jgi:hypothetical protein
MDENNGGLNVVSLTERMDVGLPHLAPQSFCMDDQHRLLDTINLLAFPPASQQKTRLLLLSCALKQGIKSAYPRRSGRFPFLF